MGIEDVPEHELSDELGIEEAPRETYGARDHLTESPSAQQLMLNSTCSVAHAQLMLSSCLAPDQLKSASLYVFDEPRHNIRY